MAYLRELVSGNWQAVVRRSGHKPISKSFDTKAQALQWARLLESEIDRGIFVDRSECEQTSVGELIDRYLREISSTSPKDLKNDSVRRVLNFSVSSTPCLGRGTPEAIAARSPANCSQVM